VSHLNNFILPECCPMLSFCGACHWIVIK